MGSFNTIILGLVNFLILCALIYWFFGPSANQFFYSRRAKIRKQMFNSVMTLRHARAHAARSKEHYEGLPHDIETRKQAISKNCDKECRHIVEEAHRKAEHIMKAGERRAAKERNRHATLLRERLMRQAFRIAEERIRKTSTPAMQEKYLEKGFDQLDGIKVSKREAVSLIEE